MFSAQVSRSPALLLSLPLSLSPSRLTTTTTTIRFFSLVYHTLLLCTLVHRACTHVRLVDDDDDDAVNDNGGGIFLPLSAFMRQEENGGGGERKRNEGSR